MNSIIMNINGNADINVIYSQLKKQYPKMKISKTSLDIDRLLEEAEDEYLLDLALERKKNDKGVRYSFEEILAKDGLTLEDLDKMEDVELEYELPG